jgi:hypothetical protein
MASAFAAQRETMGSALTQLFTGLCEKMPVKIEENPRLPWNDGAIETGNPGCWVPLPLSFPRDTQTAPNIHCFQHEGKVYIGHVVHHPGYKANAASVFGGIVAAEQSRTYLQPVLSDHAVQIQDEFRQQLHKYAAQRLPVGCAIYEQDVPAHKVPRAAISVVQKSQVGAVHCKIGKLKGFSEELLQDALGVAEALIVSTCKGRVQEVKFSSVVPPKDCTWSHFNKLVQHVQAESSADECTLRVEIVKQKITDLNEQNTNVLYAQVLYFLRQSLDNKAVACYEDACMRFAHVQVKMEGSIRFWSVGLPHITLAEERVAEVDNERDMERAAKTVVQGLTQAVDMQADVARVRKDLYYTSTHPELVGDQAKLGAFPYLDNNYKHNDQAITVAPLRDYEGNVFAQAFTRGCFSVLGSNLEFNGNPSAALSPYSSDYTLLHAPIFFEFGKIIENRIANVGGTKGDEAYAHTLMYNVVNGQLWTGVNAYWTSGNFHPRLFSYPNTNVWAVRDSILAAYYHATIPLLSLQTSTQLGVNRECEREVLNYYSRLGVFVARVVGRQGKVPTQAYRVSKTSNIVIEDAATTSVNVLNEFADLKKQAVVGGIHRTVNYGQGFGAFVTAPKPGNENVFTKARQRKRREEGLLRPYEMRKEQAPAQPQPEIADVPFDPEKASMRSGVVTGLTNTGGNDCFINTALQILFASVPHVNYIHSIVNAPEAPLDDNLIRSLRITFNEYFNGKVVQGKLSVGVTNLARLHQACRDLYISVVPDDEGDKVRNKNRQGDPSEVANRILEYLETQTHKLAPVMHTHTSEIREANQIYPNLRTQSPDSVEKIITISVEGKNMVEKNLQNLTNPDISIVDTIVLEYCHSTRREDRDFNAIRLSVPSELYNTKDSSKYLSEWIQRQSLLKPNEYVYYNNFWYLIYDDNLNDVLFRESVDAIVNSTISIQPSDTDLERLSEEDKVRARTGVVPKTTAFCKVKRSMGARTFTFTKAESEFAMYYLKRAYIERQVIRAPDGTPIERFVAKKNHFPLNIPFVLNLKNREEDAFNIPFDLLAYGSHAGGGNGGHWNATKRSLPIWDIGRGVFVDRQVSWQYVSDDTVVPKTRTEVEDKIAAEKEATFILYAPRE